MVRFGYLFEIFFCYGIWVLQVLFLRGLFFWVLELWNEEASAFEYSLIFSYFFYPEFFIPISIDFLE